MDHSSVEKVASIYAAALEKIAIDTPWYAHINMPNSPAAGRVRKFLGPKSSPKMPAKGLSEKLWKHVGHNVAMKSIPTEGKLHAAKKLMKAKAGIKPVAKKVTTKAMEVAHSDLPADVLAQLKR